jgi:hypothetical protein
MPLLAAAGKPVHLVLNKDLTRAIKTGNPWLYSSCFAATPAAPPGSLALVKTRQGEILAKGIYDPTSQLSLRIVALQERLDEALIQARLQRALALRQRLFEGHSTTGEPPAQQHRPPPLPTAPPSPPSAAAALPPAPRPRRLPAGKRRGGWPARRSGGCLRKCSGARGGAAHAPPHPPQSLAPARAAVSCSLTQPRRRLRCQARQHAPHADP